MATKTNELRRFDPRERIAVRRKSDGSIRNVGILVAEKGLESGFYEPVDIPAKRGKKSE